jgi:hypothetical protein
MKNLTQPRIRRQNFVHFTSENRLTSFLQTDLLYCLKAIIEHQIFKIDKWITKVGGQVLVVFFYNILQ